MGSTAVTILVTVALESGRTVAARRIKDSFIKTIGSGANQLYVRQAQLLSLSKALAAQD